MSRVSGADTGAKTKPALPGWSAGRRNAPSRPHEERRERGDSPRERSQRRDERDAEVPALNQLSSQGTPTQPPRIAEVGELTLKPGDGAVGGLCQPRTQAPPARSVAIRPPPRAKMRYAFFFMMSPHVFFASSPCSATGAIVQGTGRTNHCAPDQFADSVLITTLRGTCGANAAPGGSAGGRRGTFTSNRPQ